MCSEGLSDFCSIAPHKCGHFVEYMHVSLHISASLSICDSRTECVNLQGVLLWHFCDRLTPNTRAVLKLPKQLKSLLATNTRPLRKGSSYKTGSNRWTCTSQECWRLHWMQVSAYRELKTIDPQSHWCSPHQFAPKSREGSRIFWNIHRAGTGISRTVSNFMNRKSVCTLYLDINILGVHWTLTLVVQSCTWLLNSLGWIADISKKQYVLGHCILNFHICSVNFPNFHSWKRIQLATFHNLISVINFPRCTKASHSVALKSFVFEAGKTTMLNN